MLEAEIYFNSCLQQLDEKTVMTFERKILRTIFGPVIVNNRWKIRKNYEIEKL